MNRILFISIALLGLSGCLKEQDVSYLEDYAADIDRRMAEGDEQLKQNYAELKNRIDGMVAQMSAQSKDSKLNFSVVQGHIGGIYQKLNAVSKDVGGNEMLLRALVVRSISQQGQLGRVQQAMNDPMQQAQIAIMAQQMGTTRGF